MKITKDLLKIAHELDANGLYDLADSIESIALSLAYNGIEKFARAGNWQTMVDMIARDSTDPNEAAAALNRLKAFVAKGKAPPEALEQAEKAMSARLRDIAQKSKPSNQMSVRSLTIKDVAAKTNPQTKGPRSVGEVAGKAKALRGDPSNSWKTGLKGAKPGMVSGLLGGAVGTHAGATIGEAIGGDTGELVGGIVGGVAGGTVAGTPLGKALLAGWTIGTIINEAGLGDIIQKSLFAGEDASMEAEQLKGMMAIFDKTAEIIDHTNTTVETKVQKILNIDNLVKRIIEHPAASSLLGQDGVKKFRDFKVKMDAGIAAAAASAPAVMKITTEGLAATPAPRKAAPSPAIRQLQVNLNKLHDANKINLSAKLVVDGLYGKYTRGAISAFDPASGGRVTPDLLRRVSDAAANAGNVESESATEAAPPPMSIAAPFIPGTPMI